MTTTFAQTEFTIPEKYKTNRSGPLKWVFSHAIHSWPHIMIMFIGAFGNAALAALVPVYVGQAFEAILASPPLLDELLILTIWLIVSQLIRSVLQLGRNFGAEIIGQRLERDVRAELYASLLGKSMTFHHLQPVGDTMARATNDVREVNLMMNPGINLVIGSGYFLLMPLLFAPATGVE